MYEILKYGGNNMSLSFIVNSISVVVCIFIAIDMYLYRKYDKTLENYFVSLLKDFNDNRSSKSF